eukprot:13630712-Alexandrium_andersonii.AAC.1
MGYGPLALQWGVGCQGPVWWAELGCAGRVEVVLLTLIARFAMSPMSLPPFALCPLGSFCPCSLLC